MRTILHTVQLFVLGIICISHPLAAPEEHDIPLLYAGGNSSFVFMYIYTGPFDFQNYNYYIFKTIFFHQF